VRGLAEVLSLAAAPTFAVMALVSAAGGGPLELLCVSSPLASPMGSSAMGGMTPMYLLMSLFHLAPWLRLVPSGGTRA
jgi:hypothetical protein